MSQLTRREFIKGAITTGAAASILPVGIQGSELKPCAGESTHTTPVEPEWRNRVDGMHYRQLGRTGLMVSEVVMGAFGSRSLSYVKEALDLGLNYLDTASRYAEGRCEEAIGELNREGMRDRYIIATKISEYLPALDALCRDLLNGLPSEKQHAIRKQAAEHIERLGVMRPGYYYSYFEDHDAEIPDAYLTHTILREYGYPKSWQRQIRQVLENGLDGSLRRLQTDCIDILHCPHGARLPEELEDAVLIRFFENARKSGKIRHVGLSAHSDMSRILTHAANLGHYDIAMVAYNIINQGAMEPALAHAANQGMGLIAMKVARAINRKISNQPVPEWRVQKLNTAVDENMKPEMKAYLWALQNPHLSAVISAMENSEMVKENLTIPGKRIDIHPY